MKSQAASLKRTTTSESPSTKVIVPQPTTTVACKVIQCEFSIPPKPVAVSGAIDIDDLVAEFEQTVESSTAIAKGRQWVAKSFYSDRTESIAHLRLSKGWSQKELAKRVPTSQSYIARLELGNVDPQVSTLKKLAKALGVPAATLLNALSREDE